MLPPRIGIYSYVAMCPPPVATLLFVVSISPPRRRMSALSSSAVIQFNPLATTVHVCLHSTDSLIPSPPATPPAVVGRPNPLAIAPDSIGHSSTTTVVRHLRSHAPPLPAPVIANDPSVLRLHGHYGAFHISTSKHHASSRFNPTVKDHSRNPYPPPRTTIHHP